MVHHASDALRPQWPVVHEAGPGAGREIQAVAPCLGHHEVGRQHVRHVIKRDTDSLESLRAILGLQPRHELQCVLAVRTRGEEPIQKH